MAQGLQIGQVARETGLSVDTIRFYERQSLFAHPPRTEGGFRLFTEHAVQSLHFIRRAQELGFSLKEIRELLVLQDRDMSGCSHVRDLLRTKLTAVRQKIAELQELENQLAAGLRKCDRTLRRGGSVSHDCCPMLNAIAGPNTIQSGRPQ